MKHILNKINKITVLYNLPGTSTTDNIAESDEDTQIRAQEIAQILSRLGFEAYILGINVSDIVKLPRLLAGSDFVFNLIEWSGRESIYGVRVLKILKKINLPYSGSHAWGYAISCNKVEMKKLFDKFGIDTPKWKVIEKMSDLSDLKLKYPVICKPVYEHCGIGISQSSVVKNIDQLRSVVAESLRVYEQPILVEEFVAGTEAHVTVIEKKGRPVVLPAAVFDYQLPEGAYGIMGYDAKWKDTPEAYASEWVDEVDPEVAKKIASLALKCYAKLGGRSYPRIDMRIRNGQVFVLEINNNPGIGYDPDSGQTHALELANIEFDEFIGGIVREAVLEWYDPAVDKISY